VNRVPVHPDYCILAASADVQRTQLLAVLQGGVVRLNAGAIELDAWLLVVLDIALDLARAIWYEVNEAIRVGILAQVHEVRQYLAIPPRALEDADDLRDAESQVCKRLLQMLFRNFGLLQLLLPR